MMIWECRKPGVAPQQIGQCQERPKNGADLARILSNAQTAGHAKGYRVAVIWHRPGRTDFAVNLYQDREAMARVKSLNGFAIELFYEAPENNA